MSNDAAIKKFRATVESKRTALGTKPKAAYTTNALLDTGDGKVNLNTLTTVDQCVAIVGTILTAVDLAKRANEVLGTDVQPKFGDFTADQWVGDVKLRVSIIQWEAEKKKLNAMDKKLEALRSEDAKTADAIEDIAAQLAE